jgi:hypothetical protein
LSNSPKEHQQQRKQIIEGVYKLFEGRRKIDNNINDIKMEHSRLLEITLLMKIRSYRY